MADRRESVPHDEFVEALQNRESGGDKLQMLGRLPEAIDLAEEYRTSNASLDTPDGETVLVIGTVGIRDTDDHSVRLDLFDPTGLTTNRGFRSKPVDSDSPQLTSLQLLMPGQEGAEAWGMLLGSAVAAETELYETVSEDTRVARVGSVRALESSLIIPVGPSSFITDGRDEGFVQGSVIEMKSLPFAHILGASHELVLGPSVRSRQISVRLNSPHSLTADGQYTEPYAAEPGELVRVHALRSPVNPRLFTPSPARGYENTLFLPPSGA